MTLLLRMWEKVSDSKNQGESELTENIGELPLTVKEAAAYIEESPYVVRNWMRELKEYIPTKKGDNNYHYFDQEALERLILIKKLNREQNYSIKQIAHYLATDGQAFKPEPEPNLSEEILKELGEMSGQLKQQEKFNEMLIKKLDEQNQYIERKLNERDKMLMESLRSTLEQTKQLAASKEDERKKKGLFKRLFNK